MEVAKRILVLDDNVDVAESLGEILEMSGYSVTLAHDGATAIELYFNAGIDVGLFDVKMPGINGVDALIAIKSRKPDAIIMMMSGYADECLVAKAFEVGAAGLLNKPFEAEEMLKAIDCLARPEFVAA